jgi:hypothetical protein
MGVTKPSVYSLTISTRDLSLEVVLLMKVTTPSAVDGKLGRARLRFCAGFGFTKQHNDTENGNDQHHRQDNQ